MMGWQTGNQRQLFYLFNLERRIPASHLLRRINPPTRSLPPGCATIYSRGWRRSSRSFRPRARNGRLNYYDGSLRGTWSFSTLNCRAIFLIWVRRTVSTRIREPSPRVLPSTPDVSQGWTGMELAQDAPYGPPGWLLA
jgi:hypothetical protein